MKAIVANIDAARLRDWIAPALTSAGKDDMIPVLMGAQIRVHRDHALIITCDRFTAALSRLRFDPTDSSAEPFALTVNAAALGRALRLFPVGRSKRNVPGVAVSFTPDGLTLVGDDGTTLTLAPPEDPTYGGRPENFPDVLKLYRDAFDRIREGVESGPLTVTYKNLDKFKAAAPARGATMIAPTGTDKQPWLVRPHDDFLGLVMPRRWLDGENPRAVTDGWHDALGIDAPQAVSA